MKIINYVKTNAVMVQVTTSILIRPRKKQCLLTAIQADYKFSGFSFFDDFEDG